MLQQDNFFMNLFIEATTFKTQKLCLETFFSLPLLCLCFFFLTGFVLSVDTCGINIAYIF